ncbi:hypothetical protein MMC26_005899 [Xylographa opegraphella]|nr:hypothetical protein [Xylographa opegraphella]
MRFKSSIRNVGTFTKLTASLNSLGKVAWIRLDNEQMRCTVIPEQGSQETIFDDYAIQSAAANNTIDLEVPLASLQRALRSAQAASAASIRLTKKDGRPLLSLTILTHGPTTSSRSGGSGLDNHPTPPNALPLPSHDTTITQDIPIRVLSAAQVAGIHEPRCRDPDVHILLPPLHQLKSISERFTRIGLSSCAGRSSSSSSAARLEIAATMHGALRVGLRTEALRIQSRWEGLANPELDAANVEGGEEGVRAHPSTRMKALSGEEAWAVVRVEGRDWGRVLGVGRLGGRVIACFCHDHALILYVYLPNDDAEDSVLTYYIKSYSA